MTVLWIEPGCESAGGPGKNLANLSCRNQYLSWETDVFHQLIFSIISYCSTVLIQSNGGNCIASTTWNLLCAVCRLFICCLTVCYPWMDKRERVPDPKTPEWRIFHLTSEKLDQHSLWFNGLSSSETKGTEESQGGWDWPVMEPTGSGAFPEEATWKDREEYDKQSLGDFKSCAIAEDSRWFHFQGETLWRSSPPTMFLSVLSCRDFMEVIWSFGLHHYVSQPWVLNQDKARGARTHFKLNLVIINVGVVRYGPTPSRGPLLSQSWCSDVLYYSLILQQPYKKKLHHINDYMLFLVKQQQGFFKWIYY